MLEIFPIHGRKIESLVKTFGDTIGFNKSVIFPPNIHNWGHRRDTVHLGAANALELPKTGLGIDLGQVDHSKSFAAGLDGENARRNFLASALIC